MEEIRKEITQQVGRWELFGLWSGVCIFVTITFLQLGKMYAERRLMAGRYQFKWLDGIVGGGLGSSFLGVQLWLVHRRRCDEAAIAERIDTLWDQLEVKK